MIILSNLALNFHSSIILHVLVERCFSVSYDLLKLEPVTYYLFVIMIIQFMIGDGNNVYDFTYVENVAHAHICAERALASGGDVSERASGQVYSYN